MFNIGSGELALIAVVALLVLGPKRLPELARGIGKFMREFRRQTDEVRGVVEREFYKMDEDVGMHDGPQLSVPEGLEHTQLAHHDEHMPAQLNEHVPSQLTAGAASEALPDQPEVAKDVQSGTTPPAEKA
jgi:Tat protein translocase TatB subunit